MMLQQWRHGRFTDQLPVDALQEMRVRIGIAFDQDRPVRGEGDIPTDDHAVDEGPMRCLGEMGNGWPIRDTPPGRS